MHSSWPTALSAPVVGVSLALVVVRTVAFRATYLDRRANLAVAGLAVATAMREPTFQSWLVSASAERLSEVLLFQLAICVLVLLAASTIVTLGSVLGKRYSTPALLGVALVCISVGLAFGSRARAAGIMIEEDVGLFATGFWLSLCPLIVWMDVLFIRVAIAELRASTDRRDLVVPAMCIALVSIHLLSFVWGPIVGMQQNFGIFNAFTRIQIATDRDFMLYQLIVFAAVTAIPVWLRFAAWIGIDYPARCRRRLLPLWSDLTSACPECIYGGPVDTGLGSRFLLHRTVIEIRDCLRILSRYDMADGTTMPDDASRDALEHYAVRLARACTAKQRGEPPAGGTVTVPSSAEDVDDEIAELTALAKRWGPARAAVAAELRR
ncbi:DUF6545 domain-containing protein [Nocardia altamirensis]|uniref:DUF6545 domain-containing protein n=1 Tax=Nocardia altamirensis TaxID=472158 RepID=UPI00084022D9|nr:DUF6545 domain-containing protein [Nocardia altamirensis]